MPVAMCDMNESPLAWTGQLWTWAPSVLFWQLAFVQGVWKVPHGRLPRALLAYARSCILPRVSAHEWSVSLLCGAWCVPSCRNVRLL